MFAYSVLNSLLILYAFSVQCFFCLGSDSSISTSSIATSQRVMIISVQDLTQNQGGDYHMFTVIKAFELLGYQVTFCVYLHEVDSDEFKLEAQGVHIMVGSTARHAADFASGTAVYDIVIEFLWAPLPYLKELLRMNRIIADYSPSTKIVVVNADIMHERAQSESGVCDYDCRTLETIELSFWESADAIVSVSETVNEKTKKLTQNPNTFLLPYCELTPTYADVPWSERSGVIFFGFPNRANTQSVEWLLLKFGDTLNTTYAASIHLYGVTPPLTCTAARGCYAHGEVSTDVLVEAIRHARWMVAPLLVFAGVSTKVIKALSLGTPVITTPQGIGGMNISEEDRALLVVEKKKFVGTVLQEYGNQALWERLHANTLPFVSRTFGIQRLTRHTTDLLDALNISSSTNREGRLSTEPQQRKVLRVVWEVEPSSRYKGFASMFPGLEHIENTVIRPGAVIASAAADVYIRLTPSPADFNRPAACPPSACRFVLYLSWTWGALPITWPDLIHRNTDALWVMSSFELIKFEKSGLSPAHMRLVPLGILCDTSITSRRNLRGELDIPANHQVYGYIGNADDALALAKGFRRWVHTAAKTETLVVLVPDDEDVSKMTRMHMVKVLRASNCTNDEFTSLIDMLYATRSNDGSLAALSAVSKKKTVIGLDQGVLEDYFMMFVRRVYETVNSVPKNCIVSPCRDSFLCFNQSLNPLEQRPCVHIENGPMQLQMEFFPDNSKHFLPDSNHKRGRFWSNFVCEHHSWHNMAKVVKREIFRVVENTGRPHNRWSSLKAAFSSQK